MGSMWDTLTDREKAFNLVYNKYLGEIGVIFDQKRRGDKKETAVTIEAQDQAHRFLVRYYKLEENPTEEGLREAINKLRDEEED